MKLSMRWSGAVAVAAVAGLVSAGAASASSSGAGAATIRTASQAATSDAAPIVNSATPVGMNAVNFTGNGFDTCSAPTEAQMAAWRASSPYDAIGINIGGENRACAQPNLTPQWVQDEAKAGWHFFLLYAGPQAPGSTCQTCTTMTEDPVYQAQDAAQDAVQEAATLGFQPGTPIFYDLQDYAEGGTNTSTVGSFLASWVEDLQQYDYVGAVHGGMDSTVQDLVADYANPVAHVPSYLDFASGDGQQSTDDSAIPQTDWPTGKRINEYALSQSETWGGTTLTVDSDYLDLAVPSTAPGSKNLYAITSNGTVAAWLGGYDPLGGAPQWMEIGGQATDVYAGDGRVFATFSNGQGIFEFDPDTGEWVRIGGPGAQFAVVGTALYGLTPGRSQVYQWSGTDYANAWTQVGGPAAAIYGGNAGLVATNPQNTAVYQYTTAASGAAWHRIGNGGAEYAESGDTIFGLTPGRSAVYQWTGDGATWTRIGGAAQDIYGDTDDTNVYAGGSILLATTPGGGALYTYDGTPGAWGHLGGPGVDFAQCAGEAYGLESVGGYVSLYIGYTDDGGPWMNVGGPFTSIHCF